MPLSARPVVALVLLVACGPPAPPAPPPAPAATVSLAAPSASAPLAPASEAIVWQSPLGRAHPLVGKLWDVRARAFVDEAAVLARARQATFVLLGEKHDNPDHHRLQARVVAGLAAGGRRPAVVFEMIEQEQQPALDAYLAAHPGDSGGLGEALAWKKRGWPDWALYQPIAAAALGAGLPLRGGNLTSAEARAVVKGGMEALGSERVARWGLTRALPGAEQAALEQELSASHCGHLPAEMLPGMASAQRARDAALADALLASQATGAVLIAGAGHTRRDRGVPWVLRGRAEGVTTLSVAFVEVHDDEVAPPVESPHEVVWFTPRLDDEDPCARMKPRADPKK